MKTLTKLSRPRLLRAKDAPLTMEQIAGVAPAVFADKPHSSRAVSYAYVPTTNILDTLLENGFGVYAAGQQRSRKEDRDPYTKHMLRLRRLDQWARPDRLFGTIPELVLVNAHDGTAAYHLIGGLYRLICANGLMVGRTFQNFRIRHTSVEVTRSEVLTGGMKIVADQFSLMMDRIDRFSQVMLNDDQRRSFARQAAKLRYGDTVPPFAPEQLLQIRRSEDNLPDVWSTYNVIQENLTQGGFETRSILFNRRSMVRPVERVTNLVRMNQGLWDIAEELSGEVV